MLSQTVFQSAVPVIPASDMIHSVNFYARLGFKKVSDYGDYAILRRDDAEIHLFINDDPHLAEWTSFRVKVADIDRLCREFRGSGVDCKIEKKPWGTKDLSLTDPTGVLITFQEYN